MKNPILVASLVILLCFTFGFQKRDKEAASERKANVEADVAAIKALIDEWVQLYNAEDFDRLMSVFYADNATLMSPNVSISKGKEAILLSYQADSKLNVEHVDSSVGQDVRVSGSLAVAWGIDTGTTTPRSGGEAVKYDLKWLMAFERQSDGTWKCLYEMWNENTAAQTQTEQELLKLEQEWTNADLKDDWATMDRILADDYVLTDRDGFVSTKAQCLAYMKSGEDKYLTLVIDDTKVRVYGDAAVVTGRATIKEAEKGKEISDVCRITNTWIKKAGRWQCVATHSSRIAQK